MTFAGSNRYEFGANWASFIDKHYSAERRQMAADKLLSFLGKQSLEGMDFLDIGSGSGLHSLAAFDAKADRIHSFDFDPLSVRFSFANRANQRDFFIVNKGKQT